MILINFIIILNSNIKIRFKIKFNKIKREISYIYKFMKLLWALLLISNIILNQHNKNIY